MGEKYTYINEPIEKEEQLKLIEKAFILNQALSEEDRNMLKAEFETYLANSNGVLEPWYIWILKRVEVKVKSK